MAPKQKTGSHPGQLVRTYDGQTSQGNSQMINGNISTMVNANVTVVYTAAIERTDRRIDPAMLLGDAAAESSLLTRRMHLSGDTYREVPVISPQAPVMIGTNLAQSKPNCIAETDVSTTLSDIRYLEHHEDNRVDRLPDSGQWLTRTETYIEWRNSPSKSRLWLHGIPGSGKTKLISLVIDDLRNSQTRLAYHYCAENSSLKADEILRCVLKQFLASEEDELQMLKALHGDASRLSISECTTWIMKLAQQDPTCAIIIDALEKCGPTGSRELLEALNTIYKGCTSHVMILVSSWSHQDSIRRVLSGWPEVCIHEDANAEDIRAFIEHHIEKALENRWLEGIVSDELRQQLADVLTGKAQGMFGWVSLQLAPLLSHNMRIEDDVRHKLRLLAEEKPIRGIYSEIFDQILLHDDPSLPSCLLAQRVLKWLLCSRRRLSKEELIAAVTLETVPTAEQIQSIFRGLVIFDKALGEFRFANDSVTEMLGKREGFDDASSHAVAAERCLQCFLKSTTASAADDPLRSYAALYWPEHCDKSDTHRRNGPLGEILAKLINEAAASESELDSWLELAEREALLIPWDDPTRQKFESTLSVSSTIFFASCAWGWEDVIQRYKAPKPDIFDQQNERGQTGLHVATEYGHTKIVRSLLEAGADVNSKARDGSTALHLAAAATEDQTIVELLLGKGASVDAEDYIGRRALHIACGKGSDSIVSILVEHGSDIGAHDYLGTTALILALKEGHEALALRLVSASRKTEEAAGSWKALHMAAEQGTERVVDALLKIGANVMVEDPTKMTPLHRAALEGHVRVSSRLITAGADVAAKDEVGYTPVIFAAARGHETLTRLLLDANADAAAAHDNHGCTALHHAAVSGHEAVMDDLIDHGADIQARDKFGRSPLYHAVAAEQKAAVELLLNKGAIDEAADDGKSSLHLAAERGYFQEVETMLLRSLSDVDKQVDINRRDSEGRTALLLAAMGGHTEVVELLQDFDADDNIRDNSGMTFHEWVFSKAVQMGLVAQRETPEKAT